MPTISLVSASVGDQIPGHELADPDCPSFPGLLDRPDVKAWLDEIGYGPDSEDELVYLVTQDDRGMIPAGFEHIAIKV
ncbi:hypothetical protein GCM10012285_61770 [Streptomyces kronopolitis]|uniref:Uncharacterized protein n=2 Tax=Streptomyces kronopolitis TaxID=1612435 RepID=A0ABQ2K1A6_9ACTN|nr:hypothetical protein GCM10012285_61770 [Streptomyces kronopolitis]